MTCSKWLFEVTVPKNVLVCMCVCQCITSAHKSEKREWHRLMVSSNGNAVI